MKKITAKMLRGFSDHHTILSKFEETWPDGAELTLENCLKVAELGFDIYPLVSRYLSAKKRAEFNRQEVPLRDELHRQIDLLWAELDCQRAKLFYEIAVKEEK